MNAWLPFLIIGTTVGSVYALAGIGLVLTYKTSRLFNFSHGAVAALAAFVFYDLRDRHGMPWPFALVLTLTVCGLGAGLLLERLAASLQDASVAARVIATVGVLVALQGALVVHYGSAARNLAPFLPTHTTDIGGVGVGADQMIIVAIAVVSCLALGLFLTRTAAGLSMRGLVENSDLLALQAIRPTTVRRLAWAIGTTFTALSGVLLAPMVGLDVNILTLLVVQAFGAAAVGAFASLSLTFVGGLAMGVGGQLLSAHVTPSFPSLAGLPPSLPFLVLIAALLLTPARRLAEPKLKARAEERPPADRPGVEGAGLLAAGAAALVVVPFVVGGRLPLYMTALVFALLFLSLALLTRTSGQVSLCHMAFAAVGAAVSANALNHGVPWGLAMLLGALAAVPVGAVVAVPAIRLAGVYLAVATLGLGILLERLAFTSSFMFGLDGQVTSRRPAGFTGDRAYYFLLLAVVLCCCALVSGVRRGRLGRLLRALADAPIALEAGGAGTASVRVLVFCLSAGLAGLAGALYGPVTGSASTIQFGFGVSLVLLAVASIAGRRPVLSTFVAAALYAAVPGYLPDRSLPYLPIAFGVAAVISACRPGYAPAGRLARTGRGADRATARPRRAVAGARL